MDWTTVSQMAGIANFALIGLAVPMIRALVNLNTTIEKLTYRVDTLETERRENLQALQHDINTVANHFRDLERKFHEAELRLAKSCNIRSSNGNQV